MRPPRSPFLSLLLVGIGAACGDDASSPRGDSRGPGSGPNGSPAPADTTSAGGSEQGARATPDPRGGGNGAGGGDLGTAARRLAIKLRGRGEFLIGMGNDLGDRPDAAGAYTLGTTLDLHYLYLAGLPGRGGWPDWNGGGTFVNIHADAAAAKSTTPMFTLYTMAAAGEANLGVLTDDGYMGPYWAGMRLLYERLAAFGAPAVVHFEPDFWAFAQQRSPNADATARVTAHVPECAALTDDVAGMGQCLVVLGRALAPKAALGFHASSWAGSREGTVAFLRRIGADRADFVATDMLDRDAGCFEAHTDPNCQRGGAFYWDESNRTSPNFHEHLAWAKSIHSGVGVPLMWWQVPFGVPRDTPGGSPGRYRDNRVRYLFAHTDEFVAAGGVGAVFGTGAANQTYITSDGGQFKNAVAAYRARPTPLP